MEAGVETAAPGEAAAPGETAALVETAGRPRAHPTRRRVLRALFAAAASLLLGRAAEREPRWAALHRDPDSARELGRAYLRSDEEPDTAAVGDWMQGFASCPDTASLRRALSAAARADLACADVVTLAGWVVARSEARACAALVLERA